MGYLVSVNKNYYSCSANTRPGRVAQSVGHLTRKSGVLGSIPGLATYFRFSFRFFKKGSCQLLAKVLVNRLGGLSLPRKSVVRLTDRPDMTLDVYRGRKTTIQQLSSANTLIFRFDFIAHEESTCACVATADIKVSGYSCRGDNCYLIDG